ncbi:hypothetical protein HY772_08660 [Candidatus Woesearchaeota archaeon]|nr:hypothetical protein [Candidatus Woesearchaeota archaeon]
MKMKNFFALTAFLLALGFSCFQSVLAQSACASEDGWQILCYEGSSIGQVEIFNKSQIGVWLDIHKEFVGDRNRSDRLYFQKHILLKPGQSEPVEFKDTTPAPEVLRVLNCATEQDPNTAVRCPEYLEAKNL